MEVYLPTFTDVNPQDSHTVACDTSPASSTVEVVVVQSEYKLVFPGTHDSSTVSTSNAVYCDVTDDDFYESGANIESARASFLLDIVPCSNLAPTCTSCLNELEMLYIDGSVEFRFLIEDANTIDILTYSYYYDPDGIQATVGDYNTELTFLTISEDSSTGEIVFLIAPTDLSEVGEYLMAIYAIDDNSCGDSYTLDITHEFTLKIVAENEAPQFGGSF